MAAMAALPEGIVAFLLTDLEGSTRLWESQPGAMRKAMVKHDSIIGDAVDRHARALATSHGGQIVLSKAAHELVVDELPSGSELWDLGLHRLKDLKRPEQVFQLVDLDRPARYPPIRSLPRHLSNLPVQLTTFVGRQEELRKLKHLQAGTRLLTLAGPGGSGKTRLAE